MIGIGTPKIDGSVEPKSWLVHHEGETRDIADIKEIIYLGYNVTFIFIKQLLLICFSL